MVEGGMVICRPKAIKYKTNAPVTFRLISDLHIGHSGVSYDKIKRELKEADENGDRILINGDVFDMIIPSDGKRFVADILHKRLHGKRNILNEAIKWAVEILGPYYSKIDMIGVGNHEASVEKYHSADPVALLIDAMKSQVPFNPDHKIHHGGYSGFVDYKLYRTEDKDGKTGGSTRLIIWYHHGYGGSAPVTHGVIDFARAGWVNADVKWFGHKHTRMSVQDVAYRCPVSGSKPIREDVRLIRTGSYFETYHGQSQDSIKSNGRKGSYAADACMAPQGIGGALLSVTIDRNGKKRLEVTQ